MTIVDGTAATSLWAYGSCSGIGMVSSDMASQAGPKFVISIRACGSRDFSQGVWQP
jgi:hypothetical protein